MRGYWNRVALRALVIFGIGLAAWYGFQAVKARAARRFVEIAERSDAAVNAANGVLAQVAGDPGAQAGHAVMALDRVARLAGRTGFGSDAANVRFTLEDQDIGRLTHLRAARSRRGERASFELVVALVPAWDAGRLATCNLIPLGKNGTDMEHGFRCVESADGRVVRVGQVRFEPGGIVRPIMVREADAAELVDGDTFQVDADLSGPVSVNVRGDDGSAVHLGAGERGAVIDAADRGGNTRARFYADSQGAAFVVIDGKGRKVVRFSAGPGGFGVQVDSTGPR